jgi:uncharacterized protein YggE
MKKYIVFVLLIATLLVGCTTTTNQRTISVSGVGTTYAKADMATFNLSVSEIAPTTSEAQKLTTAKVDQVLKIVKEAKIEDDKIKTTSLNIYPEYRYKDGEQFLVGQRVSQSLFIEVEDLETTLATLLDQIAQIDNISINSINFSKQNSASEYSESRALAIENATKKAAEFADASNVKLGKVLTIIEGTNQSNSPILKAETAMVMRADTSSFNLPSGQLEFSSSVSITIELL